MSSYGNYGDTTKSVDEAQPWREPEAPELCRRACGDEHLGCMADFDGSWKQWKGCEGSMRACLTKPECRK